MAAKFVCVFGGTGFLGRRIVRHLAAAGMRVRVVARRPARPEGLEVGNIELQAADIRDAAAVATAVAGARAVVNAVSLYVETRDISFAAIHVDGAERLARLARDAGVERLVHVSGIGADPGSSSRYVAARGLGELRVRSAFPQATALRPSVLFGAGDTFLSTLDGITRLPVVPLFGAGRTRLQPVHVDDVAGAVVRILQRPDTAGSFSYRYPWSSGCGWPRSLQRSPAGRKGSE
jgi:NADH dehydrogenase